MQSIWDIAVFCKRKVSSQKTYWHLPLIATGLLRLCRKQSAWPQQPQTPGQDQNYDQEQAMAQRVEGISRQLGQQMIK